MSRRDRRALTFAALGDATRLGLVTRLGEGGARSIAALTAGTGLSRQAVTKHLRVLEGAGLVRGTRRGRECLYRIAPEPFAAARACLEDVSRQWEEALERLRVRVRVEADGRG